MVDQDSDDYELMPSSELDGLRREVSSLKKNSLSDGDKAKVLVESMDRLAISINRLITILDDAQKDIIDEYQESKPAEKLNQLLEQNEMIAKALIAISNNVNSGASSNDGSSNNSGSRNILPPSKSYQNNGMQNQNMSNLGMQNQGMPSMPQQNAPMSNPRGMFPPSNNQMNSLQMNSMQMNQPPAFGSQSSSDMSPMDDLPPMDTVPPLDSPMPQTSKKKFLGIM